MSDLLNAYGLWTPITVSGDTITRPAPEIIRPIRLQRRRTPGFNLQAASRAINGLPAQYVGRGPGGIFPNPFYSKDLGSIAAVMCFDRRGDDPKAIDFALVGLHVHWLAGWPNGIPPAPVTALFSPEVFAGPPTVEEIRDGLRDKNPACWCPLIYPDGQPYPCHADTLLEIANG